MDKITKTKENYVGAVGRRKTSVARVRISESSKESLIINDRDAEEYFPTKELRNTALEALKGSKISQKFKITARVSGGGISSQAGAVRHGVARAIIAWDENLRKTVKGLGFLKRDARMKERRKFGLKKARKAPQWSKR
jgi:small subunit ribosomal protein S9